MKGWLPLSAAMLFLSGPLLALPAEPASLPPLFNPAHHMRVADIQPGMRGHGLTVLSGTKIERFEVEVISILRNFNPKGDVILIRCRGANLEFTGAIAGMSGSPVYIKDATGRDRMIGAFAYGWPLTKEPLAGVQPIEYMLALPGARPQDGPAAAPALRGPAGIPATERSQPQGDAADPLAQMRWSVTEASGWPLQIKLPRGPLPAHPLDAPQQPGNRLSSGVGDVMRLQPLATPLMASGLSPRVLDQFGPMLRSFGLVPVQAGGGGSAPPGEKPAKLEPGSVLAVPLLIGDADMTAIGSCTEVIGDRIFGFGHPFQNEGAAILPMGSGRINSVIPNLTTSFKLGSLTATRGRLTADGAAGVSGKLGDTPPMVPIDIRVIYADGSQDRRYHFDAALHPRFTPLLGGMGVMSAVSGASDLPQYNTVDYDIRIEFANGETIRVENRSVNMSPMELFQQIGMPMMTAAENPFERVLVKRIGGTVRVTPESREGQILSINVPKSKYRPGETVSGFVTYKPFRQPETTMPVSVPLPKDLTDGTYQLVISDWTRYATDEQQSKPFRFTAQTVGDVFEVLKDISGIRHNALYLRLVRQPDGVAIGRTAMPQLPSSRRQILMGAGRSNVTRFVSSTVKVMPTNLIMTGAADFTLTIDRDLRVEPGKAGPGVSAPPAPGVSVPPVQPDLPVRGR